MITETNEYSVAAELADLDNQIDMRMKAELENQRLTERVKVLEKLVKRIAARKLESEMSKIELEYYPFEDVYNGLVEAARAALGKDKDNV